MTHRTRLLALLWMSALAGTAQARTLDADIAKIRLPMATLETVHVQLDWPDGATQGTLSLQAARVQAPDLGIDARHVAWTCPLQRIDSVGWACDGTLRSAGKTYRLAIAFDEAGLRGTFSDKRATLAMHRATATPDLTRIDLTRVPIAWAQGLLAQSWADARLQGGTLDGRVDVAAPSKGPLQITGRLNASGVKLETTDATIASDKLAGTFDFDYKIYDAPHPSLLSLDGTLRGGEFLAGSVYVALPDTPIKLAIRGASREGAWTLSRIEWADDGALHVAGNAAFDAETNLRTLDLSIHSDDLEPVRDRYLTGLLGIAGVSDLALTGGLDAQVRVDNGALHAFDFVPHHVDIVEPTDQRFAFHGLDGTLRFSRTWPIESALQWHDGLLYGLKFGGAKLPMRSEGGAVSLTQAVSVPLLGGALRFDNMTLRPPADGKGAEAIFGLSVDKLDISQLATALDWPVFRGQLTGHLPRAHYANERLDFEGGLSMAMFDGQVDVSSLSMERPFGVAPTLAADLRIDDLDLLSLTEVFDFGSITGRLDGSIDQLRLVDWSITAFDAELHTDPKPGIRQRISQRAVQSISSVGGNSLMTSIQGQLIGLFDDFGYKRLAIGCHLVNEVCDMRGLHSGGDTFTIVEGAGLPRLTVIGHNRLVDWPTFVERLSAVGSGEVSPVVE